MYMSREFLLPATFRYVDASAADAAEDTVMTHGVMATHVNIPRLSLFLQSRICGYSTERLPPFVVMSTATSQRLLAAEGIRIMGFSGPVCSVCAFVRTRA